MLFGKGWKEYFVDILNGKGNTKFEVKSLLEKSYSDILRDDIMFRNLVELAFTSTISKIRYNTHENIIIERIHLFSEIVKDKSFSAIREMF